MTDAQSVNLDEVLANSYRDFHVKGFDYLCLKRTPTETIKAYFFDGDVAHLPEVVIPHDHRYAFSTKVLAGQSRNRRYLRGLRGLADARPFEAFNYLTPLNGGDGFSWSHTDWLMEVEDTPYLVGETYDQRADEIHTIQITGQGTILLLKQGADVVPVGCPTRAYRPDGMREAPSLDGLYRPMTADHALDRLATLAVVAGAPFQARAA